MNDENSKKSTDTNALQPIYMAPPDWYHAQETDDEIDLVSLFAVLWHRKKVIVGVTAGLTLLAVIFAYFVLTPKYRTKALVSPGIIGFDESGLPVHAESLSDLQQWLTQGGYIDNMISRLNPQALRDGLIPGPDSLEVSVPRNGQILTVSMFAPEPDQAEKTLEMILDIMADSQAAYDHARKRMEKTIEDLTIKLADWDIQQARYFLKVDKFTRELELMKKDLLRIQKNIDMLKTTADRLAGQIEEVNENTRTIRELRNGIADTKENEMALLMYANIIQQNIDNAVRLGERRDQILAEILDKIHQKQSMQAQIVNKEWELDDLKENQSRELEAEKKEISRQLEVMKAQYAQLTPLQIIQQPMSSTDPVKPDKIKIVALAGIMGVFMGIMLAFIIEFVSRNKDRFNQ